NGSLGVTVTLKDGDLDTAPSNAADISGQISFDDDGPSVTIAANAQATVGLDESATTSTTATINTGSIVIGDDPDVAGSGYISKASSGSAMVNLTSELYGADGQAASGAKVYALSITNSNSGLTLTDGSAITLVDAGNGVVVGQVASGAFAGKAAFAIQIDSSTGVVTVEQYLSLHQDSLSSTPDDTVALANGSLGVTVTLKDGDLDTAPSNAADISGQISFDDDGPSVTIAANAQATVGLDESATTSTTATINTGSIVIGDDPDVAGSGYISKASSGSAMVNLTSELYGADGQAASGAKVYALSITNSNSGLTLTDGSAITLVDAGNGVVVGQVASGAFAGKAAFAIQIDSSTGVVTVEQYLSLHQDSLSSTPDDTVALANGSLGVTVTLKDGDLDTAPSNAADISGQISFDDDGPSVTIAANAQATVGLDESATTSTTATINTGSIVIGDDPDVAGSGYISKASSGSAMVNLTSELYGADGQAASGAKVYALSITNSNSGLTLTDGSAITLVDAGNGVVVGQVASGAFAGKAAFAIQIDSSTGVVTVEQYLSLHQDSLSSTPDDTVALANGSLGVTVTLKDGDLDTAPSNAADISGQISFDDDGPSVTI